MKRRAVSITAPSVDEIIQETSDNYNEIMTNIARITAATPTHLTEDEANTNMLLVLKRYINSLAGSGIILSAETLAQVHKLVSVGDNITNNTFLRLTDMLKIRWEINLINPNHNLFIMCDGNKILDKKNGLTIDCTLENMMLTLIKYITTEYGELDLRKNTEYIQPYTVNNIMTAVKYNRRISSYIFEKFCKLWNISYSYTITSTEDEKVSMTITLDPSGWM